MSRFHTRDALWLGVVVALILTLWLTRGRQVGARIHLPAAPAADHSARTPPASGSPATPADLADHRREAPAAELTTATRLGEHPAPVRYLKLSPDGRQLLSASGGAQGAAELRLWDIASSKLVQTFAAASAQISGLGFAPDGKRVVAASPTAIQLWDIASGHDVARQWVGEAISCFDVAPRPGLAALGLMNGDVVLWDYAAGIENRRLRGHTQPVRAVAFLAGGQRLVTAADDQTLRLWNIDTGESLAGDRAPPIHTELQEQKVAQAQSELAAARLARDEYLSGTFVQEEKRLLAEVFVAEQNYATAKRGVQSSQRLIEKGIVTVKQLERADAIAENARQILELWQKNLETLRKYTKPRTLKERDNAIAAAEANLRDEEERLGEERAALGEGSFARLAAPIRALAVSPDGKQIAVALDVDQIDSDVLNDSPAKSPAVIVFDAKTGAVRHELRGSAGILRTIAFTPRGQSLVASGSERLIYRWELPKEELVDQQPSPEGVSSLVIGPDGRRIFTAAGSENKSASPSGPPGSYAIRSWPLIEN